MSDDKPFADENPFLKLDKKHFKSVKPQKGMIPVVRKVPEKTKEHAIPDESEARSFLDAVSGATPLGSPKKPVATPKKSFTPPLENPVFGTITSARDTSPAVSSPAPAKADEPQNLSRRERLRHDSREAERRNRESSLKAAEHQSNYDEYMTFSKAMGDVQPLAGKGRDILPEIPPPPVAPPPVEESNPLQDFMDGKLKFALAFTDEYVEGHVLGLDLITVGKLQAGQFSPEAHLDLHGMNAQQAFDALIGFIRASYLKGHRTLLVVSGRGLNSPQGMPVLKDKLQSWFTQDPFRRVILAFCTAKPSDGGAGALYVMLRKFRKDQGKVYWDRKPADPDLL